jgi:hypothetical protein
MSALMMGADAVLCEGALLLLFGTDQRLEKLLVAMAAVTIVSLALLPLCFRLPARLRRKYEFAEHTGGPTEPRSKRHSVRRLSLRAAAVYAGVPACWMFLVGLTSHDVVPPVMLVPVTVALWARSRATAGWEQTNEATLWQVPPKLLGPRGPVFRVSADGQM